MGLVTKWVGKHSYVYLVKRQGSKVIYKYVGTGTNPATQRMLSAQEEIDSVPSRFSVFFWDTKLENIHLKKNARYVIERILETGNLEAMNWLLRVYTVHTILEVLYMSRTVSEKSRTFWKLWFGEEYA